MLIAIITAMGCSNDNHDPLSKKSGESIEHDEPTETTIPRKVRLQFSETDSVQPLIKHYSLQDIIVEEQLEHGLIVYTKGEEETEPFIGIQSSEEQVTEIGTLFEEHYAPDVSVQIVEAFGEDMIAIQAICGAACGVTYLVSTHHDTDQLYTIYGMSIVDLDDDGSMEVMALVGSTNYQIELYRKNNNQIEKANLNQALESDAVAFHANTKTFETTQQGQRVLYTFDSEDCTLNLISND